MLYLMPKYLSATDPTPLWFTTHNQSISPTKHVPAHRAPMSSHGHLCGTQPHHAKRPEAKSFIPTVKETPPCQTNTNGGGAPLSAKRCCRRCTLYPKSAGRATAMVSKRLCDRHFPTPVPGLMTRLGYTEKPSKVGLLGWLLPGVGVRLQLGSGADSGESSHMALMKSTTSLPCPSPGTLQAPADAMPSLVIVFFTP